MFQYIKFDMRHSLMLPKKPATVTRVNRPNVVEVNGNKLTGA